MWIIIGYLALASFGSLVMQGARGAMATTIVTECGGPTLYHLLGHERAFALLKPEKKSLVYGYAVVSIIGGVLLLIGGVGALLAIVHEVRG